MTLLTMDIMITMETMITTATMIIMVPIIIEVHILSRHTHVCCCLHKVCYIVSKWLHQVHNIITVTYYVHFVANCTW